MTPESRSLLIKKLGVFVDRFGGQPVSMADRRNLTRPRGSTPLNLSRVLAAAALVGTTAAGILVWFSRNKPEAEAEPKLGDDLDVDTYEGGVFSKLRKMFGLPDDIDESGEDTKALTEDELSSESLFDSIMKKIKSKFESPSDVQAPDLSKEETTKPATVSTLPTGSQPVKVGDTISPPKVKGDLHKEYDGSKSHEFPAEYKSLNKIRFTEKEFYWAKKLVKSKASIRASTGSAMNPYIKAKIIERAIAHGLPPDQMLRVAAMESGGNPNAVSGTGAVGVFQFTSAAASDYGLSNRFDADANIEAGMLMTKANSKKLQQSGLTVAGDSATAIYLAHQIGPGGAREVLSVSPSTPVSKLSASTQKNIRRNFGGSSKTVGEYISANSQALEDKYSHQLSKESAPTVSYQTFNSHSDIKISDSHSEDQVKSSTKVSVVSPVKADSRDSAYFVKRPGPTQSPYAGPSEQDVEMFSESISSVKPAPSQGFIRIPDTGMIFNV